MGNHPTYESILWAHLPQETKKQERDRLHAELRTMPEFMDLFMKLPEDFDHNSPIIAKMLALDIPFSSQIVDFSRILKSTKDLPGVFAYCFLCDELKTGGNIYVG